MVRRFSPVSSGLCCRRMPNTRSAQPKHKLIRHITRARAALRAHGPWTDMVQDSRSSKCCEEQQNQTWNRLVGLCMQSCACRYGMNQDIPDLYPCKASRRSHTAGRKTARARRRTQELLVHVVPVGAVPGQPVARLAVIAVLATAVGTVRDSILLRAHLRMQCQRTLMCAHGGNPFASVRQTLVRRQTLTASTGNICRLFGRRLAPGLKSRAPLDAGHKAASRWAKERAFFFFFFLVLLRSSPSSASSPSAAPSAIGASPSSCETGCDG